MGEGFKQFVTEHLSWGLVGYANASSWDEVTFAYKRVAKIVA